MANNIDISKLCSLMSGVSVDKMQDTIKDMEPYLKKFPNAQSKINTILNFLNKIQPMLSKFTSSSTSTANKQTGKDEFDNLLTLALGDGVITEEEKKLLHKKATEVGISDTEFQNILKNAEKK